MTAHHEGSTATRVRSLRLTVNDAEVTLEVEPRRLLSDFLRDDLGLTGTHVGCEQGVCGACTVLVDGRAVRSCLTFAVMVDGAFKAKGRTGEERQRVIDERSKGSV